MVLWLSKDLGFNDQAAGAIGRLGLGAGHDGIHASRRFADRCDRIEANIFSRRRDLHGRAQRDGDNDDSMAGARLRCSAARCRRGARHAGFARRDAPLLDHAQRSISFSIIYAIMNVGYLAAGYIFDFVQAIAQLHPTSLVSRRPRINSCFSSVWRSRSLLFPAIYFSAAVKMSGRQQAVWLVVRRALPKPFGKARPKPSGSFGRSARPIGIFPRCSFSFSSSDF